MSLLGWEFVQYVDGSFARLPSWLSGIHLNNANSGLLVSSAALPPCAA